MNNKLEKAQKELDSKEFTSKVGDGAVSVTIEGNGTVKSLLLDDSILNSIDREILEDMICLAFNNALKDIKTAKEQIMKDISGGLPIPAGMSLPF